MADKSPVKTVVAPAFAAIRGHVNTVLPVVVLLLLVVIITTQQPSFISLASIRGLLLSVVPILLLALGLVFVLLTGGIDLSIAAVASFGTVLLALWLPNMGGLAILAMLAITTAIGVLNGIIVAYAQAPSFIVTLGAMGAWSGFALAVSGASAIRVSDGYELIGWLTDLRLAGLPIAAVLCFALVALIAVMMRLFSRGRLLHALGFAERAVTMSGVHTRGVRVAAFGASGLFAGLAALYLTSSQYAGGPTLANTLLLPAIAAVVIGGTVLTGGVGGPVRALVGSMIIVVLRVGLSVVGVSNAYEQVVYGAVIIGAVVLTIDRERLSVIK